MIHVKAFESLPMANRGWLKARFHFVPAAMAADGRATSLGPLIAWNDDEVAPHGGFPEHPHDNVEIVTYVQAGAITHRDTLGHHGLARAGEVQVMSAGSGLRHTEANEGNVPARLFQIWLKTRSRGIAPRWATGRLPEGQSSRGFVALASGRPLPDGNALPIHADARVLVARLAADETIEQALATGRGYLVPVSGALRVGGQKVGVRDGCLLEDQPQITVTALAATEVVLVELI